MSTTPTKKEVYDSEIQKRSEEELLEEETRNQQTIDIFIESDKNWCWSKIILKELLMNLKTSPFSILNKERRELDYIKGVYKRRVQAEIDSYKDSEDESKRDTIQTQDVLMIDRISIWLFIHLLMLIN